LTITPIRGLKEQAKAVSSLADHLSDILIQPPKIRRYLIEIVIMCPGISDNQEVRMAIKEDILNEKTHRDLPVAQRIYYTLTDNEEIKARQTAKTLGLLLENLVNKGILSGEDIDDILFEIVRHIK
jgi:hypothetical protein